MNQLGKFGSVLLKDTDEPVTLSDGSIAYVGSRVKYATGRPRIKNPGAIVEIVGIYPGCRIVNGRSQYYMLRIKRVGVKESARDASVVNLVSLDANTKASMLRMDLTDGLLVVMLTPELDETDPQSRVLIVDQRGTSFVVEEVFATGEKAYSKKHATIGQALVDYVSHLPPDQQ